MNTLNYCVSGIWKSNNAITHVLLHELNDNDLGPGIKVTMQDLMNLLIEGKSVRTVYWNYQKTSFYTGVYLSLEKWEGYNKIRYVPGDSFYGLEHLPFLNGFFINATNPVPLIRKRRL